MTLPLDGFFPPPSSRLERGVGLGLPRGVWSSWCLLEGCGEGGMGALGFEPRTDGLKGQSSTPELHTRFSLGRMGFEPMVKADSSTLI